MRRAGFPIGAVLVGLIASPASAADEGDQWVFSHAYRNWSEMSQMEVLFSPREIEHLEDDLGLSPAQRSAFRDLLEAGERRFELMWVEAAERESDIDDAPWIDDSDWDARQEEIDELRFRVRRERELAATRVLEELELLLTKEQLERAPIVMRDHRRRVLLYAGSHLWGEGVDLVSLVGLLDIDDATMAEIEPILDEYASEMDAALTARTVAVRALDKRVRQYLKARRSDNASDKLGKVTEDTTDDARVLLRASERTRTTTAKYARRIATFLDGEAREKLDSLLATPPHPGRMGVGEVRGLRLLQLAENIGSAAGAFGVQDVFYTDDRMRAQAMAARRAEPLSASQRERIAALRVSFDAQYARLRIKHKLHRFEEIEHNWLQLNCGSAYVYLQRQEDDGDDWALKEYYVDVAELSAETAAALREILTVRQRVLLQSVDY